MCCGHFAQTKKGMTSEGTHRRRRKIAAFPSKPNSIPSKRRNPSPQSFHYDDGWSGLVLIFSLERKMTIPSPPTPKILHAVLFCTRARQCAVMNGHLLANFGVWKALFRQWSSCLLWRDKFLFIAHNPFGEIAHARAPFLIVVSVFYGERNSRAVI